MSAEDIARKARTYYATPGPFTELSGLGDVVRKLPKGLDDLCRLVQGLVVHPFLTHLYGLEPEGVRRDELETRRASRILEQVFALDARPLTAARSPERRFVGNCRHFSVLLCAILRAQGVPARARCGFAAYFEAGEFVDHWVCEIWDEGRGDWRLVDAQIDAIQRDAFGIDVDTLDVPRNQFIVGGDAWQRCRTGSADPQRFGIMDLRGLWFVRGNVVRDLAAFAKRELLPWDCWGLMTDRDRESDAAELRLLDRVAALTLGDDSHHAERLELQSTEPGLRLPREVLSFNLGGATVDLGVGAAN